MTLQKAIELAPDLSSTYERLGYCLWREGKYKEACENYEKAIDLDSKNSAAFAGHGVVLMTQYLDSPENTSLRDRAVEEWHNSLELNPQQPKLRELVEKYRIKPEQPVVHLNG